MKRRWGFWNNILAGIPISHWRALRRENRIDPSYLHKAGFLTLSSFRNSLYQRREERLYGDAIARTRIYEAPLFVLGHWRSGTTHLHNMLACDVERFAAPNSIQTTFPFTFLCTEAGVSKQFEQFVPRTRPMDNVLLDPRTPQEDEFALCAASLLSPLLGMCSFPRRAEHYDRYLTLRDVDADALQEWKDTFLWLVRKLTFKLGRRLVLKSPTHTARIGLLLELFPDAQFIHIHRHPYAVFQSNRHLLQSLWSVHSLQTPSSNPDEQVLRRHELMYDAFFAERSLIPAGRLHEVSYEDLAEDPLGEMRRLYEALGFPSFEAFQPKLQAYLSSISGYRKNEFSEMDPALRERVRKAWERSFAAWGYGP